MCDPPGFMARVGKVRLRLALAGAIALGSSGFVGARGEPRYWIIVHPDNPVETLKRSEVSRLFLKKTLSWADGTPAVPIDLDVNAPAREAFSQHVHRRAPEAIKKYWQRMVFSGKAAPPAEVATEEDVLAHVRGDPAAIGYVSDEVVLRGVKILDVIDKPDSPEDEANDPTPRP